MELSQLLPESHIILGVKGDTPEAIIKTLAQPLVDDGILSDLDSFVAAVLKREELFTTQVADYVAFPHTHAEQVKQISLVIGLTEPEGLVYAPNTPLKCRLFFLIAVPENDPEAHLELMANLVNFVMSGKLPAALDAKTADELRRLITE